MIRAIAPLNEALEFPAATPRPYYHSFRNSVAPFVCPFPPHLFCVHSALYTWPLHIEYNILVLFALWAFFLPLAYTTPHLLSSTTLYHHPLAFCKTPPEGSYLVYGGWFRFTIPAIGFFLSLFT
jgi:hypothetical protein